MAYALIANSGAGSSDGVGVTTGAVDTSGATLIVLTVIDYELSTITLPTDSKSNTWTPLSTYNSGASVSRGRAYYCVNPTVGSGHTFSYSAVLAFPSICMSAWSSAAASPFDQENGFATGAGGASSIQPGSVTPSENNELLITASGFNGEDLTSVNGGFTISNNIAFVGGQHFSGAQAYLIQTTAAAANPTWNLANPNTGVALIATFKAAAAPAGGNSWYLYDQMRRQ